MSVSTKSSPHSLFKLLAGTSRHLSVNRPSEVLKVLEAAQPANYAVTLSGFERCRDRFAKACQRYEQGPQSLNKGLQARYLEPEYLQHMAQAMPGGNFMPIYFHNARWPFQFARQEEAQANPYGYAVLSALAHVRRQQASLLWQVRRVRHPATQQEQEVVAWRLRQVEANRALLKPLEPIRHALRQQAVAQAKQDVPRKDNVLTLRQHTSRQEPALRVAGL